MESFIDTTEGTSEEHSQLVRSIQQFAPAMEFRRNQQVVVEGAESLHFYYVDSGNIEVSYPRKDTRIVVALIGAGNFFGVVGFFDGTARVRNIRATEHSMLRVFDAAVLQAIAAAEPELYNRFLTFLLKTVCEKFRRVLDEREPMTAYAAALATGSRRYKESKPLPSNFFETPEWKMVNKMVEEFKAKLFDISYNLQKDSSEEIAPELQRECDTVLDDFNEHLRSFKGYVRKAEYEDFMWGYVFKEIFPYFMRSRFAERAYYKPKGYAGDFLMMEMIYQNQPQGDGKLGTIVDHWLLQSVAAKAVRGRRELLSRQLEINCAERAQTNEPIRIMNLACGPNRELFDFIARCSYSEKIEALCVDIDTQALEYTNRNVNIFPHRASIRLLNENLIKWSLGRARQDFGPQDIIYSAGLTDYLEDKLFVAIVTRCYQHLKPGGVLIIGNFAPNNPDRMFMDHLLHWKLIHRDEQKLHEIFAQSDFGADIQMLSEAQGVNLFALAVKH